MYTQNRYIMKAHRFQIMGISLWVFAISLLLFNAWAKKANYYSTCIDFDTIPIPEGAYSGEYFVTPFLKAAEVEFTVEQNKIVQLKIKKLLNAQVHRNETVIKTQLENKCIMDIDDMEFNKLSAIFTKAAITNAIIKKYNNQL